MTSGDSWQTDIDVSYLNEGFHSLHVQVRDEKGRWSSPVTRHFYKLPKTDNMVYYYWFDTGNEPFVCNNEEVMWLDVSKLDDGMHTLHIQLGDEVSASVVNFHFLKIPQIVGVDYMTCLCYIDGTWYVCNLLCIVNSDQFCHPGHRQGKCSGEERSCSFSLTGGGTGWSFADYGV